MDKSQHAEGREQVSGLMNGMEYATRNRSSINYLMDKFEKSFTTFKEAPESENKLNLNEARSLIEWGKKNGMITAPPPPKDKVYNPLFQCTVKCRKCGKEFTGRLDQRYCSVNCKLKSETERRSQSLNRNVTKDCVQCGKAFTTNGTALNCSPKCSEAWARNRRLEYKRLKRAERSAAKREAK